MRVLGLAHLAWLMGIATVAVLLSVLCRRERVPTQAVRIVLACGLAACELIRYYTDGLQFPKNLPLNLCNVSAWVAVIACLTLAPAAVEWVYFAGLSGASMAVLTPDMGAHWPPRFFITHGALIVAAIVLTYGRIAPLRAGAVWRAYGQFAAFTISIWIFDGLFAVNYMYLCTKPGQASLFSLLGPWPTYVFGAGAVALGLFWLLWLPARPRTRIPADEIGVYQGVLAEDMADG